MFLLQTLTSILSAGAFFIIVYYFVRDLHVNDSRITNLSLFSTNELEEAKRYAAMFGIDNEADVDINKLLKMGRKMESYLGSDKAAEIHEAIVQARADRHFYQSDKQNGVEHRLHIMMKVQNLVATVVTTSFIRNAIKALGGDRNAEPSSLY